MESIKMNSLQKYKFCTNARMGKVLYNAKIKVKRDFFDYIFSLFMLYSTQQFKFNFPVGI